MHRVTVVTVSLLLASVWMGCGAAGPVPEEETAAAAESVAPEPEEVVEIPDAAVQIAAAVQAAPPDLREGAAVRAYGPDGALVLVRRGGNGLTCIADAPGDDRFQTACYHDSLEPYMARGRELRAEGIDGPDNLQRRHEEVDAGLLPMPATPATVYTVGAEPEAWDRETATLDEARASRVYAIYVAGATEASTGLSTTPPEPGGPWIMRPGTPSSHVMVVPPREPREGEGEGEGE